MGSIENRMNTIYTKQMNLSYQLEINGKSALQGKLVPVLNLLDRTQKTHADSTSIVFEFSKDKVKLIRPGVKFDLKMLTQLNSRNLIQYK